MKYSEVDGKEQSSVFYTDICNRDEDSKASRQMVGGIASEHSKPPIELHVQRSAVCTQMDSTIYRTLGEREREL